MNLDRTQRDRLLRRDPGLARLVGALEALDEPGTAELASDLVAWAGERDAERRSLANEALERYRELNLLYGLAERSASLEAAIVIEVATAELARAVRRGTGEILVRDEEGKRVSGLGGSGGSFPIGEGLIGAVAAGNDGEIVNDCRADPRATPVEQGLGSLMVAPLRAGGQVLGVMVVHAEATEFTAGEHRMLSAVAALTAPALAAAMAHERTLTQARAREAELQRQLDELRNEVEERRREERVREITNTDYFRSLREQADTLRRAVDAPKAAE